MQPRGVPQSYLTLKWQIWHFFAPFGPFCGPQSQRKAHDYGLVLLLQVIPETSGLPDISGNTKRHTKGQNIVAGDTSWFRKCLKKIFSMGTIFELVAILIPSPQGRKNLNSSLRIFCPTISSWDMGLNLHFNQILSNWGGVRTLSPHESQENL